MGATNNQIGANFILGQANLSFPNYTVERWHSVLLAYLIALLGTAVNIYGPHLLDRISRGILIWNILSFVLVIIVILACNDHKQPASFVFHDFQNFTGFSTGFAAILGLLQSSFGMVSAIRVIPLLPSSCSESLDKLREYIDSVPLFLLLIYYEIIFCNPSKQG